MSHNTLAQEFQRNLHTPHNTSDAANVDIYNNIQNRGVANNNNQEHSRDTFKLISCWVFWCIHWRVWVESTDARENLGNNNQPFETSNVNNTTNIHIHTPILPVRLPRHLKSKRVSFFCFAFRLSARFYYRCWQCAISSALYPCCFTDKRSHAQTSNRTAKRNSVIKRDLMFDGLCGSIPQTGSTKDGHHNPWKLVVEIQKFFWSNSDCCCSSVCQGSCSVVLIGVGHQTLTKRTITFCVVFVTIEPRRLHASEGATATCTHYIYYKADIQQQQQQEGRKTAKTQQNVHQETLSNAGYWWECGWTRA
jgi:hypothetical protein